MAFTVILLRLPDTRSWDGKRRRITVKAIDFDGYLEEQLKRPEFRKAYEEMEEEYELAKQIIRFRVDQRSNSDSN